MGLLVWFVLWGVKWTLVTLVCLLALGKAISWVATKVVNSLYLGQRLQEKEFCPFQGVTIQVTNCCVAGITVDLLGGWLQSGGCVPCAHVCVSGLELWLTINVTQPLDARFSSSTGLEKDVDLGLVPPSHWTKEGGQESFALPIPPQGGWLDLLLEVLKCSGVTLQDAKVLLRHCDGAGVEARARSGGMRSTIRSNDWCAGIAVGSLSAVARPCKKGEMAIAVRVDQDVQQPLLWLGEGGTSIFLDGCTVVEGEWTGLASSSSCDSGGGRRCHVCGRCGETRCSGSGGSCSSGSRPWFLPSSIRLRCSPIKGTLLEEDIESLWSFLPPPSTPSPPTAASIPSQTPAEVPWLGTVLGSKFFVMDMSCDLHLEGLRLEVVG
ncbi:unnamed protein product, partial [Choristocarpus tenellus]